MNTDQKGPKEFWLELCFYLDNNHKELVYRCGYQPISLPPFWTFVKTMFI